MHEAECASMSKTVREAEKGIGRVEYTLTKKYGRDFPGLYRLLKIFRLEK
jgi:hypothetical protein